MHSTIYIALAAAFVLGCGKKEPGLISIDLGSDGGDLVDMRPANSMRVDLGTPDLGNCSEEREDPPDPFYFDANCDGLDGDEADSVFVALYGDDLNPGTKALPKATIQAAIDTASAEDKHWVLLSDGLHDSGPIVLVNGVGIAGGYDLGWDRDRRFRTTIRGANPAIAGADIDETTLLIGFEVEPTQMPAAGATVITVLLERSPAVVLRDLRIVGGVGGDGVDGVDGEPGGSGADGGPGQNGREDDGTITCDEDGQPAIGVAGINAECEDANGGEGGVPSKGGNNGQPGGDAPAGTSGGAAGPTHQPGGPGDIGLRGENGTPGAGGGADGMFEGANWAGVAGENGIDGMVGAGGGGGGGGGGGDSFCNSYGGAGGGGGSGGCGGSGGTGGGAGGASVAVFLLESDIQIVECTIVGGAGGAGASGGEGGQGGQGGQGGAGGNREDDSGVGGKGGAGGVGGRGGQGGAGAGGPAYGLYSSAPLSAQPVNTEFIEGSGGPGGIAASATGRGASGESATSKIAD